MSFFSPLRYPGGKNKLSKFIEKVCVDNSISGHYVEPYAGGASVALYLLMTDRVREITINDFDRAVYAFWFSVINCTEELVKLIKDTPVNVDEWDKQKRILNNKETEADVVKLGFATLFLNRTNYSGVLNAGMIGGRSQSGAYKIDCRFNKSEIIRKIRAISERGQDIHVTNLDAISLIKNATECLGEDTIFYFDPPYYLKGPSLYMNFYSHEDHVAVSEAIESINGAKWIVSYDDTEEINDLYTDFRAIYYELNHTVRSSRQGNEVIFISDDLKVDTSLHPVTLAVR